MKFGYRTPSIKKSIKARTTGRVKRAMKSAVNPTYGKKGMGVVNNPKKAVYNKVYNHTTTSLLKNFNRKERKSEMCNWKNLIGADSSSQITEDQLLSASEKIVNKDLKIIQNSIEIMDKADTPKVFFSKLDLIESKCHELLKFEKYIKFTGATPTEAANQFFQNKDEAISRFLHHYWDLTYKKVGSLKTNKGKYNAYKRFYDSLAPYSYQFNIDNLEFFETMSKKYMTAMEDLM